MSLSLTHTCLSLSHTPVSLSHLSLSLTHTCLSHTCLSHTCLSHTCLSHTPVSLTPVSLTPVSLTHLSLSHVTDDLSLMGVSKDMPTFPHTHHVSPLSHSSCLKFLLFFAPSLSLSLSPPPSALTRDISPLSLAHDVHSRA